MSGSKRKALIDCNGELLEATQNVPLLVVNDLLSDDAIDAFNEMQEDWAEDYRKWKRRFVDFED